MIKTVYNILYYAVVVVIITFTVLQFYKPTIVVWLWNNTTISYTYDNKGVEDGNLTLYQRSNKPSKSCILWFGGGAFISGSKKGVYGMMNAIHESELNIDQITFTYPLRFDYTLQDMIKSANDVVLKFKDTYKSFHLIGISAGALLAGTFARKEMLPNTADHIQVEKLGVTVKSLSFLSPCLSFDFQSSIVAAIAKYYIGRGTPYLSEYNCNNLHLPTLIVTSVSDPLSELSKTFSKSNKCTLKTYSDDVTNHAFMLNMAYKQSHEVISLLVDFIKSND